MSKSEFLRSLLREQILLAIIRIIENTISKGAVSERRISAGCYD